MKIPEQESENLIEEMPEAEIAQPPETQGGEVDKEYVLSQIDLYLHRLFQIGEEFPWKGVKFQVIGIRGGVVGLAVKHIPTPPKARANHGRRPSRGKSMKTNAQKEADRQIELKRQEARKAKREVNETQNNQE